MLDYLRGYENDALRQRFDEYMKARDDRLTFGAASCFFTALNEWCGFDEVKKQTVENWIKRLLGSRRMRVLS